jgi:tetratricopeptide (TPR) repeat protein
MGVKEEAANHKPLAIIYYKNACDIVPDFFDAHYRLAVVYKDQQDNASAIAHVKECLRITPSDARAQKLLSVLK